MAELNSLKAPRGANTRKFRKGRGESSGLGKTAGKGHKGQKARSGGTSGRGFEGGQMPMQRRLPKRGFRAPFPVIFEIVNLDQLNRFDDGAVVDVDALKGAGLVKQVKDGVKVLSRGEIKKKLTVKVDRVSAAARQKIEAAGGKVEEPQAASAG